MRFGVRLEHARLEASHPLLRRGVILVRASHDGARDCRSESAGLSRARDFHRATRDVGVDLHNDRVFLRDAAAVDDRRNLHAVFLEAIDDRQRAERRRFDERAVNFRRRRVQRLTEEQSREPLVHEDGAVAVVPIERQQARLAGRQPGGVRRERLMRAGRAAGLDVIYEPIKNVAHCRLPGFET